MTSAVVVGAGLAGLSAALHLARAGVRVEVLEARPVAGGRADTLLGADGLRFDGGPTLLVMTDVLRRTLGDEAFATLRLRRLEPGYRVLWPGGEQFDMHSDVALWLAELARYQGRTGATEALRYLARVDEQYREARSRILDVDLTPRVFRRLITTPGKLRPWVTGNLRRFTSAHFAHPRVVEALTFQPLYLGMSPRRSPAVYSLLPVDEIVRGVWHAPGGTASIVAGLLSACEAAGVRVRYGARVSRVVVERGRATGAIVGGDCIRADAVVIASDREPAARDLLGVHGRRRVRYGHSALVFYVGIAGDVDLPHHTVMLPDEPWRAYAELDAGREPAEPMVYVCNRAATDGRSGSAVPLTVLTPVPNRAVRPHLDLRGLFERVLRRMERHAGPLHNRIVHLSHRGPAEFERDFGLAHGAAFGPDHGLLQMGPLRPSIACRGVSNVAFAGSGTRPGSGVPMVLISGRLAAEHVLENAAS